MSRFLPAPPCVAAVAATALPAAADAKSGAPIPPPRPPQNPHMADNPFNNIHNDPWMTDTYRIAGPAAGTVHDRRSARTRRRCAARSPSTTAGGS